MSFDDLSTAVMVQELEAHLRGGPAPDTKAWVDHAFDVIYDRDSTDNGGTAIKLATDRVLNAWLKAMHIATDKLIEEYGGPPSPWTKPVIRERFGL